MQAQHTDRQKAVPMFNAFQSKGQDDISRWLAKVSENPIVEYPSGNGQLHAVVYGNAGDLIRTCL